MFKVSALLLDDALKSATPLTNGAINETLGQFIFWATLYIVETEAVHVINAHIIH